MAVAAVHSGGIADHIHPEPEGFLRKYVFSIDHKIIGIQYIVTAGIFMILAGALAELIRVQLMKANGGFMTPDTFNAVFTMHGSTMVWFVIIPLLTGGFGNLVMPVQIGARDVAFPWLNMIAFWIFPIAGLMLYASFLMGAPAAGWTEYPPMSLQGQPGTSMWCAAVFLVGIGSTMTGMNFLVTILKLRAPGMTFTRMPLFVWGQFVTAPLLMIATTALGAALAALFIQREFGVPFFDPTKGGSPLLWQHMFWFYSHPAVYIMILPAFGILSEVIPTFARKPIFGYKAMVFAIASIAFLSFIVWAHHMFAVGLPLGAEIFFMYATMLIAVPTGVKVFNWVSTMWGGSMTFETPMLFAIAFVILFTIGGFSGLMLALVPADFQYHDTYFVVAHFHYVLVTGALFAIIGAAYYWLPKWTGNMYSEFWGKVHFWNSVIWVNVLFFPQHFLGLAGMPRRIPDYNVAFANFNMISSIGGFLFGATQLIFIGVLIHCAFFSKKKATDRVWEGAKGLEWTVPSPAPHHTFEVPPVIHDDELAHGHVND